VTAATTTDAPARTCSASRGTAREQAILDAAMELVAEIGYDRKWPGKAELIFEGLRRICEAEGECIPDTGSLQGDLAAVVGQMSSGIGGDDGAMFLGLLEAFRADSTLRGLFQDKVMRRSGETAAILLSRAADRGETVRNVDGPQVIQLAFAQLFMTTLLSGMPPTVVDQRCLVDDVLLPLLVEPRS
jgi:hypothetical protein